MLIDNKILSAPVVKEDGAVIGQLDQVDLLVFIVHLSKRAQEIFIGLGMVAEHQTVNFSDIHVDKQIEELWKVYDQSASIANFSQRNPFQIISPHQSLADLLSVLVKYHRVCVIDADQKIQNYITQSDVIKFLYENKELIGNFGTKTLLELDIAKKEVITANGHHFVIEAFKKMAIEGISAIAIVDKDSSLLGEINVHDMREIKPEGNMIDKLMVPIKDFLHNSHVQREVVSLPSNTTLQTVIEHLQKFKLHRIWIVDHGKLVGVVSLGDVFRILLQ